MIEQVSVLIIEDEENISEENISEDLEICCGDNWIINKEFIFINSNQ